MKQQQKKHDFYNRLKVKKRLKKKQTRICSQKSKYYWRGLSESYFIFTSLKQIKFYLCKQQNMKWYFVVEQHAAFTAAAGLRVQRPPDQISLILDLIRTGLWRRRPTHKCVFLQLFNRTSERPTVRTSALPPVIPPRCWAICAVTPAQGLDHRIFLY